ncbi:carbon-monoxide dehydrogenase small subunit [Haloactinopolyspora alba]|uniref:Carbon-monoxide dehydrogenase small subunit n=1 Tax=Haloactinopolyspora alba TaxID=648780 RepID=A0A2P8DVL1_9ACTN|nr:(2Fe-2S)-binding protein [Haloactinopolyspora alba]PSL01278.1 carbon-monoxide dehydrogenase small subunit [Haloactinopolyspora alba]
MSGDSMRVNGTPARGHDPGARLLDVLRDDLGLRGVKEGCGIGECGSCTVLLDGEPVCSCLVFAGQAEGRDVVTAEGLAPAGELGRLQQEFVDHQALQCGYCIPGVVVSAAAHLAGADHVDESSVREALSGNLCRCTGYSKLVAAVLATADDGDQA